MIQKDMILTKCPASFQNATMHEPSKYESFDLVELGLTLLDCMDGPGKQKNRTAEDVYQSRQDNALFGLVEPIPWVGHQELMDFLEFLFREETDVLRKLTKSVSYCHWLNKSPIDADG